MKTKAKQLPDALDGALERVAQTVIEQLSRGYGMKRALLMASPDDLEALAKAIRARR